MDITEERQIIKDFIGKDHPLNSSLSVLEFHRDWNTLMPVLVQLREKALILENFDENEHTIHGIEDSIWQNDIKSAYHLVVTAIIEHNKATE